MELDARLRSDPLLREFFNAYLQLELWPVRLRYDEEAGAITECCLVTRQHNKLLWRDELSDRSTLLDWAQDRRWNTFLRSRLFCEYRLCCTLNGLAPPSATLHLTNSRSVSSEQSHLNCSVSRTNASGNDVMTRSFTSKSVGVASSVGGRGQRDSVLCSTVSEEVESINNNWEEELITKETQRDDKSPHYEFSFLHLSRLKTSLSGTVGVTLINLWLDMEAYLLFGEASWVDLRNIRQQFYSILQSERGVCSRLRQVEGVRWMADAQLECVDKLMSYWIPRFSFTSKPVLSISPSSINCRVEIESQDPSFPFVHGLRCNAFAGCPFQSYLMREERDKVLPQLRLWEVCDKVISSQCVSSNQQILNGCWKVWTMIHDHLEQNGVSRWISGTSGQADNCNKLGGAIGVVAEQLWHAMQSTDADSAKVIVEQLGVDMLGELKRFWTKFLKEDYDSYLKSLRGLNDVIIGVEYHSDAPKKLSKRKVKKKRSKSAAQFEIDGTPLEPLGDLETLLLFEQFLLNECGELSVESLSYQLWRSATQCLAQKNKDKREAMALKIQQKYIYEDSEHHVDLSGYGSELALVDAMQDVERPTPALVAVQSAAGKLLSKAVEQFLAESGEGKDTIGSVASLGYKPKESLTKKTSGACLRNEIQHFTETLDHCSAGPISHQLKSFSSYLEEHAPLSQRKTLLNNVQFWLEVKKFNSMYQNCTSMQVLLSKAEALIDRYLDTTTPPWVKVTVSPELAAQVVAAAADLSQVKVRNHVYRLNDLLGRCQRLVFLDMVPYWSGFCQNYVAPDGSTVYLPAVRSCIPSQANTGARGSMSLLRLPPLVKRDRSPLLSYSKHKGVQWKFTVGAD